MILKDMYIYIRWRLLEEEERGKEEEELQNSRRERRIEKTSRREDTRLQIPQHRAIWSLVM